MTRRKYGAGHVTSGEVGGITIQAEADQKSV
jgi:hypothetical protein